MSDLLRPLGWVLVDATGRLRVERVYSTLARAEDGRLRLRSQGVRVTPEAVHRLTNNERAYRRGMVDAGLGERV